MAEPHRAIVFIDGNNWYHSLKMCGVGSLTMLSYAKISRKVVGRARVWSGTRYYIGQLKQNHRGYADQRRFNAALQSESPLITLHLGRIEEKRQGNELSGLVISRIQDEPASKIDPSLKADLLALAKQYQFTLVLKEKAADVMLAVDMVRLALDSQFDAAYLLAADGDYTPAVEVVKACGLKVYCASPEPAFSSALAAIADAFIPLKREWFSDCYK
jgi:uncharacterized LabA/DUF88 family protein